jgi:hypothetical protein
MVSLMLFRNRFMSCLLPIILLFAIPFSAESKGPSAQEKKLTKRVDGFYHSFVTGEWNKVTPFVSEDTRQIWLGLGKNTIKSYKIDTIEVAPGNKTAKVSVLVTNSFPQAFNAPFTQAQKSEWIYEKGEWFVKLRPRPSLSKLFKSLSQPLDPHADTPPIIFEQNPVKLPLSKEGEDSVVKISFQNISPLEVAVRNLRTNCACLTAEMDRTEYVATGQGVLTLTYHANLNTSPETPLAVQATLGSLGYQLNLPVVLETKTQ